MPPDLLSTIRAEMEGRLAELRPLILEYEQLLAFTTALDADEAAPQLTDAPASSDPPSAAKPAARPVMPRRRRSPAGGAKASTAPASKPSRPAGRTRRGPAAKAILAALEHGSHTTAELTVVTGMSAAALRRDVRVLLDQGAIQRIDRQGKTAYAVA